MDITPIVSREKLLITGYGDGYFSLNQQKQNPGNIFLHGGTAASWNGDITLDSLLPHLTSLTIDLLIIGTGTLPKPLPNELKEALKTRGISAQAMDTGAAARTYNVLLSEDRRVAAALIAV